MKAVSILWEDTDVTKDVITKRECLGNSNRCKKVVKGDRGNRICAECKKDNDILENPGQYKSYQGVRK